MKRVISDCKFPAKIWASDLEETAEKQIRNMANLPFLFKHLAVMADAHAGRGSTVGTVIATKGAIIPAAVGVDIGCGMFAVKLDFKINEFTDLKNLRQSILRSVPTGFHGNADVHQRVKHNFDEFLVGNTLIADGHKSTQDKFMQKAISQCGSLGGGNHFIEICQDENLDAWVVIHSGSRNLGKRTADIHIKNAKGLMKKWMLLGNESFDVLPDPDLAFLVEKTPEFQAYINDLLFCQTYAKMNRKEMMDRVLKDISYHVHGHGDISDISTFKVDCHHNYTARENHFGHNVWVTRKGAIEARKGRYGIIPGSMGTKSYIVEGLGNADSFNSSSHGAGRKMSRTKAKKIFSLDDLIAQTEGVECAKTEDIIDEIPGAYKDIDEVMENQKDLVRPIHTLKQILCVKGEK